MKILAIIFFVGILLDFFEYRKINKKLKKIDNDLKYLESGIISIDKNTDYMRLKLIKTREKLMRVRKH